jgi:hypothetical protein
VTTMAEYRATIRVADLPFSDEQAWEPLIEHLEQAHGDLGPVIGWTDGDAELVLSTDAPDESTAAFEVFTAVTDSLRAVGLTDRYPRYFQLEPLTESPATTVAPSRE